MTEKHSSEVRGKDLIRSKQTLREVLEVAIQFETTAYNFYNDLIPKVGKNIRYLVEELAAEEKEHASLFNELMQLPNIEKQLSEQIQVPPSNGKFSDAIHAKSLGDNPDDQAILQYALSREHAAMEQYSALAEDVPEGPMKDLFTFLSLQETEHKNELEKLYYEVVHSGGV